LLIFAAVVQERPTVLDHVEEHALDGFFDTEELL
jgi:hypothetical protein